LPVGSKVPVENFKINDAMPEIITGQFIFPAISLSLLFLLSASVPSIKSANPETVSILKLDIKIAFKTAETIFTGKNNSSALMKSGRNNEFSRCYFINNNKLS
jgi:hypothetical protein